MCNSATLGVRVGLGSSSLLPPLCRIASSLLSLEGRLEGKADDGEKVFWAFSGCGRQMEDGMADKIGQHLFRDGLLRGPLYHLTSPGITHTFLAANPRFFPVRIISSCLALIVY